MSFEQLIIAILIPLVVWNVYSWERRFDKRLDQVDKRLDEISKDLKEISAKLGRSS